MRRCPLCLSHASRLVTACVWTLCLAAAARSQESPPPLTGPALNKKLDLFAAVGWTGNTLRGGLESLARENRVGLVIDRRVDPSRLMDLDAGAPLLELFNVIARSHNERHAAEGAYPRRAPPIGAARIGDVIYVGPYAAAGCIRAIADERREEARKLPTSSPLRRELVRKKALKWADLAEPREILKNLIAETGLEAEGLEQVPHDLWAAAELPELSLIDRLTILAIQYDLTFSIDPVAGKLHLIGVMPGKYREKKSYPAGPDGEIRERQWRAEFPTAKIELAGDKLNVEAWPEEHRWLDRMLHPPRAAKVGTRLYTMRTKDEKARLGAVLARLKADLAKDGIELKYDADALAAAGISLEKRISFEVVGVEMDELLRTLLPPHGLSHRTAGKVIEITAKE